MRNDRLAALVCAALMGLVPAVAAAQANHNTARSNKSTVAAPAGDTATGGTGDAGWLGNHNTARSNKNTVAPPEGTGNAGPVGSEGAEQAAGKKGYDYYQAQSGMTSGVTASTGDAGTVGTGAGDAAEANINTSRSNTKGSATASQ